MLRRPHVNKHQWPRLPRFCVTRGLTNVILVSTHSSVQRWEGNLGDRNGYEHSQADLLSRRRGCPVQRFRSRIVTTLGLCTRLNVWIISTMPLSVGFTGTGDGRALSGWSMCPYCTVKSIRKLSTPQGVMSIDQRRLIYATEIYSQSDSYKKRSAHTKRIYNDFCSSIHLSDVRVSLPASQNAARTLSIYDPIL